VLPITPSVNPYSAVQI